MAPTKTTTDHEVIRRWVEEMGGRPAQVRGTASGPEDVGDLRIAFPDGTDGNGGEDLEPILWDEWFEKFDDSRLAFVYDEHRLVEQAEAMAAEVAEVNPDPTTRREAIEQALDDEGLSEEGEHLGEHNE
jgi:hypothetical protein